MPSVRPGGCAWKAARGWWRCLACLATTWWAWPAISFTADAAAAEVALAVADDMHGRGIATLLLEHLVSMARASGLRNLVAEVLPITTPYCGCSPTPG